MMSVAFLSFWSFVALSFDAMVLNLLELWLMQFFKNFSSFKISNYFIQNDLAKVTVCLTSALCVSSSLVWIKLAILLWNLIIHLFLCFRCQLHEPFYICPAKLCNFWRLNCLCSEDRVIQKLENWLRRWSNYIYLCHLGSVTERMNYDSCALQPSFYCRFL